MPAREQLDAAKPPRIHVRWMIRRDMAEVLAIEKAAFEFSWDEDDFILCLRQRNCIGMVAEIGDRVVGFFVYELHKTRLHILNLAVDPQLHRRGIGRAMLIRIIAKLSFRRRSRIVAEVRESNLRSQLFLRSLGFTAVSVLRDFYDDTDEDAYLMQYRLPPQEPATQLPECVIQSQPARFKGLLP